MTRQTAVVICPGRGTYNASELGYLATHHSDKAALLDTFDAQRRDLGQEPITALDGAGRYSLSKFSRGDTASGLIYACSYADYLSICWERFDIVAVTGNSMGWYSALACAGAVGGEDGFRITNTMGTLMQDAMIGGQLVYPFVDDAWREIPGKKTELLALIDDIAGLYVSINLGGMLILAGEEDALKAAEKRLAPLDRFPMRLANHAAFHTPLQAPVSARGKAALPLTLLRQPETHLIDGRGHIWAPMATRLDALWDYTFGHQVLAPYDYSAAVITAMKEFAPNVLIILGPGTTLGGATAQVLIQQGFRGLSCNADFLKRQASGDPLLLSMGMADQRQRTTGRAGASLAGEVSRQNLSL